MGEAGANPEVTVRLDAIRPEPIPPDDQSHHEQIDFEMFAKAERLKVEISTGHLSNKERVENINARRRYARCIFVLLCLWVVAIMATVIASGHRDCPIKLSDSVLIALIAGVSVNIIGLFAVVANYLFPKS